MVIFKHLKQHDHEQVDFFYDPISGLKAIVAIHNTQLGPALGGCRMYPYASEEDALIDALRLSRGMTYKSAISGLNFGGGKAVIIGNPRTDASESFFRTYGRFVDGLNGRYITCEDVGTCVKYMEWIRIETKHVVGLPTYIGGFGDPSPVTAHGVFVAMQATMKYLTGKDQLNNVRVAVQGVGHVGYHLCKELHEHGAIIYATDLNSSALQCVAEEFGVTVVAPDEIYSLDVDIFAPCAMGATINDETIPKLKCIAVVGAANNQLAEETKHSLALQKRNILWAPDYLINAGGLIDVATEYFHAARKLAWEKTELIYEVLLDVIKEANSEKVPPLTICNRTVEKRIHDISMCKKIFVGTPFIRKGA